jgi:hypothetical protein
MKEKRKRVYQRGEPPEPPNGNDNDDSDTTGPPSFDSTSAENSDDEVFSVRETSSTKFPGITTLHGTSSKSPNGTLSEVSSLSLRFSSITNHTISKDKTQGEEACNSELLAAFGQKIQAHYLGKFPQESPSPSLEDSSDDEHSPGAFRDVAVDAFNFQKPAPKSEGESSRPRVPINPNIPSRSHLRDMHISGFPVGTTTDDIRRFMSRSCLGIVSIGYPAGASYGIVKFDSYTDLRAAVKRLDGSEFRGARITCSEWD